MRLALLLAFSALSFAASAQSLRGGPPVAPGAEATLTTDTPLARAAARVLAEDERFTNPAPATVPPLADGDAFGYAVAVSGDRAVVGAYQDDDTADNAGAAYVFERADGGWALAAILRASDGELDDAFGWSVALDGDVVVVGAYLEDARGTEAGAAYVFEQSNGTWTEAAKLTAADGAAGDFFGHSVAVSGERIVAGAQRHSAGFGSSGAAYVFERSGGNWSQVAKLTPGDQATNDLFGRSVGISGDRIVVGKHRDGFNDAGAAYVFERAGGPWIETAKLTANDADDTDYFGYSVAVSGDRVVSGAFRDDDLGDGSGSAYVFEFSSGLWTQVSKLTASDGAADDRFGHTVSISEGRAVIGAYWDDDQGVDSGSAYVFERSGGTWSQTAKLTASDGAGADDFGRSVSISGRTVLAGAPGADGAGSGRGAAYTFELSGGVWTQDADLRDGAPTRFAYDIALDGDRALVGVLGATSENATVREAAYVFEQSGGVWGLTATLTPTGPSGLTAFGQAVALDGDRAFVGAPQDAGVGAVYVFEQSGGVWTQVARLTATDGADGDRFGRAVGLAGDLAVIGAPADDDAGGESGSAYVFERVGGVWGQAAKLTATDGVAGDRLGRSVAIASERVLVGAPSRGGGGGAYLFTRSGGVWAQAAQLLAADGAADDEFGRDVAVTSDRALVGAPGADALGSESGAAYVFEEVDGTLQQTAKLTPAAGAAGDAFGSAVALSGERALVGARGGSGSAIPFFRAGGAWVETGALVPATLQSGAEFGDTVALSGDLALVGAPEIVVTTEADLGSAYLFRLGTPLIVVDDAAETDEDTAVSIAVLANDQGDALSILSVTDPANGAVVIQGNEVLYTPTGDFNGTDTFTYRATDGSADAEATVTVTVQPVNDPPVAVDDDASTTEGTPVTVAVLANDTDVDGDGLTISAIPQLPTNGTASVQGNEILYTPIGDFNGTDTFVYAVTDGTEAVEATVTVTVGALNDAPIAVDDAVEMDEDADIKINAIANDSDPDEGTTLTIVAVGTPANGTAVIDPDGEITYTPAPDFFGTDSFTYTIDDGDGPVGSARLGTEADRLAEATATITVTVRPVDDPPVAVDDDAATGEAEAVTIDVLGNDTDVDGDALTIEAITRDPENGTASILDGAIVYTPTDDFFGADSLDYAMTDGTTTVSARVRIAVRGLNDAPIAVDDNATTPEDTPTIIAALANDSDPDPNTDLTITAVADPDNGTATLEPDGTITYTPAQDFFGTDVFTYTIDDGDGPVGSLTGARLAEATGTITVTVTPVNDAPVAVDDQMDTSLNTAVLIRVLDNDTDVDGDDLTLLAAGGASFGDVVVVGSSVAYAPRDGFTGEDIFEYSISDGNGGTSRARVTVAVAVTAPLARNDEVETDEDTPVIVDALANDESRVGGTLEIQSAGSASNGSVELLPGGTLRYTPLADFSGTDSFSYTVADGGGASTATVVVTVLPVNDSPLAVSVTAPPSGATVVLVGDRPTPVALAWAPSSDPDGDALSYRWELAQTDAFASVLLDVTAIGTSAETTFGDLADALATIGIASGDEITVFHRVVATDGALEAPGPASTLRIVRGIMTSVGGVPDVFSASLSGPNPTPDALRIALDLPEPASVTVEVYDTLGRRVASAALGVVSAGTGLPVETDLRSLTPGVYLYRVVAEGGTGPSVAAGRVTVAR